MPGKVIYLQLMINSNLCVCRVPRYGWPLVLFDYLFYYIIYTVYRMGFFGCKKNDGIISVMVYYYKKANYEKNNAYNLKNE
jgi:hypothetical protein